MVVSIRLADNTGAVIKRVAKENDVSMRQVFDDLADMLEDGTLCIEGRSLAIGGIYRDFESAAKAKGKNPADVLASVTKQLRG